MILLRCPSSRGQTALEYLLLCAVVAFMVFMAFSPGGFLTQVRNTSGQYYDKTTRVIMGEDPERIHGGWCVWGTCAQAGGMRFRTCECPAPSFGGNNCPPAPDGTTGFQYCSGPICGDVTCNGREDCRSCPGDCGGACPLVGSGTLTSICPDGRCTGSETPSTCPGDCGNRSDLMYCGDGKCNRSENCSTCSGDCGVCALVCGDGKCTGGENCGSCPADCGECTAQTRCGDFQCNPGAGENCLTCARDCTANCREVCGDGICTVSETCSNCQGDCRSCLAEAWCGDKECNGSETCSSCATDCNTCFGEVCTGDGRCTGSENCSTCPGDCGNCPPTLPPITASCGDGMCNGLETCNTCSLDCKACNAAEYCGNGVCKGGETCSTCSKDCAACPPLSCGDRRCSPSENCSAPAAGRCPRDCGSCV